MKKETFEKLKRSLEEAVEIESGQRLPAQMESLPSYLNSVAREIASHQKAIATRDQNERNDFTIELKRGVLSEEAIRFIDRGRAGAHLRQLCFAVARESRSTGKITKVIGRYRGFEIIARATGKTTRCAQRYA